MAKIFCGMENQAGFVSPRIHPDEEDNYPALAGCKYPAACPAFFKQK
jgi:hypothetical protein